MTMISEGRQTVPRMQHITWRVVLCALPDVSHRGTVRMMVILVAGGGQSGSVLYDWLTSSYQTSWKGQYKCYTIKGTT